MTPDGTTSQPDDRADDASWPRRTLYRAVLVVLAAIPLLAISQAFVLGTGRALADDVIDPGLDHQFRYLAGVYLTIFLVLCWCVANIDRARIPVTLVGTAVAIGGIGRGIAILDVGTDPAISVVFFVLEIAIVPALVWSFRRDAPNVTPW